MRRRLRRPGAFSRIREEWERLPEGDRPKLIIAGESLGGFGGNGAFDDAAAMLASVDGALWTGTPQFTPIWKELTRTRDAGSPEIAPVIDDGRHIRFATRPQELWETFGGEPLGEWSIRGGVLQHVGSDRAAGLSAGGRRRLAAGAWADVSSAVRWSLR